MFDLVLEGLCVGVGEIRGGCGSRLVYGRRVLMIFILGVSFVRNRVGFRILEVGLATGGRGFLCVVRFVI